MDFIDFSLIDLLDIILVGVFLYYVYRLLKGTVAIPIFIGIAIIFFIYQITLLLKMELLSGVLGFIVNGGTIALLIIFHPELRKFLLMLGSTKFTSSRYEFLKKLKFLKTEFISNIDLNVIVNICKKFSKNKIGALIVFQRHNSLDYLESTGDMIQAKLSEALLESIFYKNSPLHDGAVIIKNNTITAARVVLPVTDKRMPIRYGLRHKAAMGITETTDAFCLVISEETGKISIVKQEKIRTLQIKNLQKELLPLFERMF